MWYNKRHLGVYIMHENIAKIIFDYTIKGKLADESFVEKII